MYKKIGKRLLDIILLLVGLIVSAIPMAIVALVIKREDPGPAVFKQKRFGIHKSFFTLYKFRSMKLSTPHDVPTHQLENPEQYLEETRAIFEHTWTAHDGETVIMRYPGEE